MNRTTSRYFFILMAASSLVTSACQSDLMSLAEATQAPAVRSGKPAQPAIKASELREHINSETLERVPKEGPNTLFVNYKIGEDNRWADNWTKHFDLSGVAWDNARNGTLVSPRHMLMAQHYQRRTGDVVYFNDRSGRLIKRTIEDKRSVPGGVMPDITVALLDQDVPCEFYRVLPPREDWDQHLVGAIAISTNKVRKLLPRKIRHMGDRRVAFGAATDLSDSYAEALIVGDSGNPTYVVVHGELVLIELHTMGGLGAGGFLSDPETFRSINELMKELGGGYQLSTANITD